jgi:hypothetical protein
LAAPSPPNHAALRNRTAVVESALLLLGFLVLFALLPHGLAGDDFTRFNDVERLLRHGSLSDSRYSIVMPLISAPVLLVGEILRSPEWWAARFNVIVVAAGALVLFRLLRDRVDRRLLRQVLLMVLFASFLTNRLRDYNAEVLSATLFTLGFVLLVRRRALTGWAAIVVGVVNTPAALGGAALVAVAEAYRTRRLRYLAVPFAAALLIMGEAWIRRGGPLTTGYAHDHGVTTILPYSGKPGFSYPFLFGLLSILFSIGRGLVFFMPGLLLAFSTLTRRLLKEYRYLVLLMLLFVCGLVATYAKWWSWYGGLTWGPRFFLFAAVPASVVLAVRVRHAAQLGPVANALTLLALILSGWVGVSGAVADLTTLDFCVRHHAALEALCWYTPEFSPLWHPLVSFPELTWRTMVVAIYSGLIFAWLAAPVLSALARAVRASRVESWATAWRM